MAQPKTTGETIQVIRAALYDMARRPGWTGSARRPDILAFCAQRGWTIPMPAFQTATGRLIQSGAASASHPWGVVGDPGFDQAESRYWLTAGGDLEEEDKRRGWRLKVLDELRRPRVFVELIFALIGFVLGLVSGLLLARLT